MNKAREIVEKEVRDYNIKAENAALKKFRESPVMQRIASMPCVMLDVRRNLRLVREGRAPLGFDPFSREELVRILSAKTFFEYDFKYLLSDSGRKPHKTLQAEVKAIRKLIEYAPMAGAAKEHFDWVRLVKAFRKYLYAAATFAKSINSTAARLYLRAWLIVRDLELDLKPFSSDLIPKEDAQRMVRLERVATERLIVDAEYAAIPDFAPTSEPDDEEEDDEPETEDDEEENDE